MALGRRRRCADCAFAEWRKRMLYTSDFSLSQKVVAIDVLWCRLKGKEVLPSDAACESFRPKEG